MFIFIIFVGMTKKKIVILTISLLGMVWLGVGGYYFYTHKNGANDTPTLGQDIYSEVFSWDLINSIKVLWETNLLNEQKLKFNIDGTVKQVSVKEGESVKKWDILATLDTEELQNELKEAHINLENAQINYKNELDKLSWVEKVREKLLLDAQLRKISSSEYDLNKQKEDDKIALQDKQKSIDGLKLSYDTLVKENTISKEKLSGDLKDMKDDLDYKKQTLEDRKWNIEKQISDEKKDLETKITDYSKLFLNTFDEIDNQVWNFVENYKSVNTLLWFDSQESGGQKNNIYFWAKNTQYKNNAENYYWSFKWQVSKLKDALKHTDTNSMNWEMITNLLKIEKEVYTQMNMLWDNLVKWADESIEAQDFSLGDITSIRSLWSSLKSSWFSGKNSIDDTITKLKDAQTPKELERLSKIKQEELQKSLTDLDKDLEKLGKEYKNLTNLLPEKLKEIDETIDTTKRNLEQAKREYQDLIYRNTISLQDREFDIKTQKQDYEVALKNFNKKYANIKETSEVKSAENSVKQAQIAIDQVNKKIENYSLLSPFDGVIDFLNIKTWDKLANSSTEEKYIHLINPNMMEIKIKLDQIDIVRVKKWMEAQVNFDAYPEKIFTGSIETIDSNPTDENGVKKYVVKMIIDKWDLPIFSGMSANVDIVFEKKLWVVLVPTMSIESDPNTWETYVTLQKDGKKVKQIVEVGIASNGNTEIISGVSVWDQILEINFDANQFQVEDFSGGMGWGMMY